MRTALRPYATAGVTLIGAGMLAATPVVSAGPELVFRAVQLTAGQDVGLVVGGTGTPIPGPDYIAGGDAYIQRILPGAVSQGVFTPEGGSPIYTGVKSLPFDTSFAQGTTILTSDIEQQVALGNTVAVYGESQSSTISGMVMPHLQQDGVAADAVKFVLVGDPSNPDGGLLERFEGLSLPSLGITFSGATPPDTIYDTTIYTQEYDGFADFPKFTLNFLSDLNAFLGIEYVHPTYQDLTPDQLNNAILLPTTEGYDGNTTYYMVPMADDQVLPLLRPFEGIPGIGKALVDLLNPALTQIVNLGYDNPDNQGWDVGQANVPTTFGLFPSTEQLTTAMNNMGPALQEGFQAFLNDLEHPAAADPSSMVGDLVSGGTPSFTDIVNGLSSAFSQAYATLLPTADILTALTLNLPAYAATLFTDNIATDPLDAFGLPLAASTGLMTLAAGIEFMVLQETASSISSTLQDLF
ncbi:PE-PPE domain-containing protein [Mycolicibacter heraklionensis]|uniref:PE-PPE domain-containing protein n=1 Tax=Mycolicibacter heraklionensis TaxID=512402 RepID=A0A9X7WGA4_9MYCO|nr:PE-PPE domain-containing protein [Mycolicibacter heraklionensis]QZA07708.1 PE-PPE domain-containing protein [Mycolicibacter heraklionensis]